MSSSPRAAVFVLPTQSINELLQNQHTTSVIIIIMMMYSLLCVGLKEAWDFSRGLWKPDTASGGERSFPAMPRHHKDKQRIFLCNFCWVFFPLKKKFFSELNYSFAYKKICQLSSAFWGFNEHDVL